jgi:hypothetical protein
MEVAQDWGISVKAVPGNYRYYGYYSQDRKEIALASEDESVFFHELAHAGHRKILGELKRAQDWRQEVVAELAATTLCQIVGKTSKHLGTSYHYIDEYAKEANLSPWHAYLKVISDTEKVLNLIVDQERWKGQNEMREYASRGKLLDPCLKVRASHRWPFSKSKDLRSEDQAE